LCLDTCGPTFNAHNPFFDCNYRLNGAIQNYRYSFRLRGALRLRRGRLSHFSYKFFALKTFFCTIHEFLSIKKFFLNYFASNPFWPHSFGHVGQLPKFICPLLSTLLPIDDPFNGFCCCSFNLCVQLFGRSISLGNYRVTYCLREQGRFNIILYFLIILFVHQKGFCFVYIKTSMNFMHLKTKNFYEFKKQKY
jgi:hypothetical protein